MCVRVCVCVKFFLCPVGCCAFPCLTWRNFTHVHMYINRYIKSHIYIMYVCIIYISIYINIYMICIGCSIYDSYTFNNVSNFKFHIILLMLPLLHENFFIKILQVFTHFLLICVLILFFSMLLLWFTQAVLIYLI